MRFRPALFALALATALPALAATPPAGAPEVAAALADTGRPVADTAKDAARRPAELIAFAGVKPGQTVMDVWPAGGYWSRIFGKIVGPSGKVYAYVPAEITGFKSDPMKIAQTMAAEPGRANVEVVSDPLASEPPPEFKNTIDVVWTFENYHDFYDSFMKGADVDAFNKAVFQVLKPGAVYVIVDQAGRPGTGKTETDTLHRIDPGFVRAEVEKAGFRFVGESKVLSRPEDPKTANVFDPAIRGKTDHYAFKFVKPS